MKKYFSSTLKNSSLHEISLSLFVNSEYENVLKTSMYYNTFSSLLSFLYGHKEYKDEYKAIVYNKIKGIITVSKVMKGMLTSYKSITRRLFYDKLEILISSKFMGCCLNYKTCSKCGANFIYNEEEIIKKNKVFGFVCGHILHEKCCFMGENRVVVCSLCNELGENYMKFRREEDGDDYEIKEKLSKYRRQQKMVYFSKLNLIDRNFFENGVNFG